MILRKKINDIKIKPFKLETGNKIIKEVQQQMFGDAPYPNIYVCSMKGGGKTNLIGRIIQNIITSKTKLRIFSTTAHNDLTMKAILKKLDKYEFTYEIFESPYDENGIDIIDKQFKEIEDEIEGDEFKEEDEKCKYFYPAYIYVYDDMTDLLKYSRGFDSMLCRNRHIRTINIVSNQYYNQISSVARNNINILLLFKNIPDKKLQQIYDEKIGGRMTFEKFMDIYKEVTEQKYHFLYISNEGEYRDCFDEKISIENDNINNFSNE